MNVPRPSSATRSTRQRGLANTGGSSDATAKENQPVAAHRTTGNYQPAPLGNRNALDSSPTTTTVKQPTATTTAQPSVKSTAEEKPYETIEERKNGVVVRRFLKGKLLGKGGFAKAYWATCLQTQKQFAMKVVLKATLVKAKAKAKLQCEVKIHASLRHQYVVRFHHFFEDEEAYYMLLELAHNKSFSELMKKRKKLTQPEVQYYMWQILDALMYLHGIGVIHRDLKLGNLLLDKNMRVKIGDLGLAATVSEAGERKRTLCGTPNYIAPEILENKHGHSFQVDIWSTGVVLYTMLVGRPPYESKDVKATYKRILANDFVFPDTANLSSAAKDLISCMLQTDPAKRPSVPEIQNHRFFIGTPDAMPASALHSPPTFPASTIVPVPAAHDPASSSTNERQSSKQPSAAPTQQQQLASSQRRGRSDSNNNRASSEGGDNHAVPSARSAVVSTQPDTAAVPTAASSSSSVFRPASSTMTNELVDSQRSSAQRSTSSLRDARSSKEHTKAATVSTSSSSSGMTSSSHHRTSSAATASSSLADKHNPQSATTTAAATSSSSSSYASSAPPPRRRSRSRSSTARPSSSSTANQAPGSELPSSSSSASSAAVVLTDALNGQQQVSSGETNPLMATTGGQGSHSSKRSSSSQRRTSGGRSASSSSSDQVKGKRSSSPGFGVTRNMAVTGNNNMAATMATTGGAAGEMGTLESIHHNLATVMASIDKDAVSTTTTTTKPPHFHATQQTDKPTTWVTQYVDYTSKYGLGYLLADGSTGVYFNDSTKIVLAPGGGALTSAGDKQGVDESELRFQYMERVRSSTEGGEHKSTAAAATERFETHTLGSYPPSLHKKVTLLQHFRDYLIQQQKDKTEKDQGSKSSGSGAIEPAFAGRLAPRTAWGTDDVENDEAMVFVKKWVRTRHAILFRLSNHTVQVMFLDNTEVLLSSEATVVTYADKQGLRKSMALQEVMEQGRSDIIKRLKYTKDILRQLISSGKR